MSDVIASSLSLQNNTLRFLATNSLESSAR